MKSIAALVAVLTLVAITSAHADAPGTDGGPADRSCGVLRGKVHWLANH